MIKHLFLILILLLSSTVGLNIAYADETTVPENGSALSAADNSPSDSLPLPAKNDAGTTQNDRTAVNPDNLDAKAPEDKINQDQSTTPQINQNQNVTGDPGAKQEQNANVSMCQQQNTVISEGCKENNATDTGESAYQSQTTGIQAEQAQIVSTSATADVEQDQETGILSNQSQEVQVPAGEAKTQTQGNSILLNQSQTVAANSQADIFQGQLGVLFNSQNQLLNGKETCGDEQKQGTEIRAIQLQNIFTADALKAEQIQSAEIKSNMSDTAKNSTETGVQVKTRNYLEIIKDTSANIVRFIQEIFVNDQQVDVSNHDYSLDGNNSRTSLQNFQKQYDWGNLVIENTAFITFNEELQNYEAVLTGFLGIIFHREMTCPSDNPPQNGGQGNNNGDDNGNSNNPGDNGGSPQGTGDGGNSGNPVTPAPPQPIAPTAVDQHDTAKLIPISTKTPPAVTVNPSEKSGNNLPNTGTDNYNLLIFGSILLVLGAGLFLLRKKA